MHPLVKKDFIEIIRNHCDEATVKVAEYFMMLELMDELRVKALVTHIFVGESVKKGNGKVNSIIDAAHRYDLSYETARGYIYNYPAFNNFKLNN